MKTTAIFVLLEFIVGFGFAIGGIHLFSEYDTYSLNTSILLTFLIAFFCILIGVGLAGYFHLRMKHVLNRFGLAMAISFVGTVLFLVLYLLLEKFLPNFGLLILFIPLTGAVFGFNLMATKARSHN